MSSKASPNVTDDSTNSKGKSIKKTKGWKFWKKQEKHHEMDEIDKGNLRKSQVLFTFSKDSGAVSSDSEDSNADKRKKKEKEEQTWPGKKQEEKDDKARKKQQQKLNEELKRYVKARNAAIHKERKARAKVHKQLKQKVKERNAAIRKEKKARAKMHKQLKRRVKERDAAMRKERNSRASVHKELKRKVKERETSMQKVRISRAKMHKELFSNTERLKEWVPNSPPNSSNGQNHILNWRTFELMSNDADFVEKEIKRDGVIVLSFSTLHTNSARKVTGSLMYQCIKIPGFKERVWGHKVEFFEAEKKARVKYLMHYADKIKCMECKHMKQCLDMLMAEQSVKIVKVKSYRIVN